jgi:hypothetical protein
MKRFFYRIRIVDEWIPHYLISAWFQKNGGIDLSSFPSLSDKNRLSTTATTAAAATPLVGVCRSCCVLSAHPLHPA